MVNLVVVVIVLVICLAVIMRRRSNDTEQCHGNVRQAPQGGAPVGSKDINFCRASRTALDLRMKDGREKVDEGWQKDHWTTVNDKNKEAACVR